MGTKGRLIGLLAAALAIAVAGAAYSYEQMPTPEDMGLCYSLSAGFVSSVNSHVNNPQRPTVSFAWYGPANEAPFGDMAAFGLSADWVGIQRNDGKDVNLALTAFNYKQSAIIGAYRVFVTVGVGIRFSSENIPEMRINDGSTFGWTGGVGLDFTNQFFGQARFLGGEHPGQDGLAAVELGYRF